MQRFYSINGVPIFVYFLYTLVSKFKHERAKSKLTFFQNHPIPDCRRCRDFTVVLSARLSFYFSGPGGFRKKIASIKIPLYFQQIHYYVSNYRFFTSCNVVAVFSNMYRACHKPKYSSPTKVSKGQF